MGTIQFWQARSRRFSTLAAIAFTLTAGLLLLLPAGGLSAETIVLKNGQILGGKIVGQSRTSITLQTPNGRRTIQKSQIRRIDYKSPAEVRAEEQRRIAREEAERKKREEAAREAAERAEQERLAREEAERLQREQAEQQAVEGDGSASETAGETAEAADAGADPGAALIELFGTARFGGALEWHDSSSADVHFDQLPAAFGNQQLTVFDRDTSSTAGIAPVFFYEQDFGWPWLVPGFELGAIYRKDQLRPNLLLPAMSGWELFARPSLGVRYAINNLLFVHLRGYFAFHSLRMDREFYAPEWNLQQGLVLDRLESIRRFRVRNPESAGPGLRIALEIDRFRVYLGRQWLRGQGGDARFYRDNWIAGVGVSL